MKNNTYFFFFFFAQKSPFIAVAGKKICWNVPSKRPSELIYIAIVEIHLQHHLQNIEDKPRLW